MAVHIKRVEYYHTTVEGRVEEGAKLLGLFAGAGVSLLAFKAAPLDAMHTRFTLFPDDGAKMTGGAENAGLALDGPYAALLVEGDDEPGACADVHEKLSRAGIHVEESTGIAGIKGGYGILLYVKSEDCEKAAAALAV